MNPNKITVHCSATKDGVCFDVNDIRQWHKQKGWSDCGYHYVITLDGEIQTGRPIELTGAHVKWHNKDNIGICLIGGLDASCRPTDTFTVDQFDALRYLITDLSSKYGIKQENIKGHRDYEGVHKECPCFSVQDKLKEWL